jgi:hypothetical protein
MAKRLPLGVMSEPQREIVPETGHFVVPEVQLYSQLSKEIANAYMGSMTYYSTTLDVIAVYLKGQKTLYIESKTYCEMCLYLLMLPAIFISATCTVLSGAVAGWNYGNTLIGALTGINSFILGVVTYLKLDAKAEAHRITSYQFDKLQNICEFYSGKTLMIEDKDLVENIKTFFETIEKKVSEIKDVNQFPIPESIRYRYSRIYGFNVFAEMKEYKTNRNKDIQELVQTEKVIKEHGLTEDLQEKKTILINKIIEYRNYSKKINDIFEEESNAYRKRSKWRCFNYFCLKS